MLHSSVSPINSSVSHFSCCLLFIGCMLIYKFLLLPSLNLKINLRLPTVSEVITIFVLAPQLADLIMGLNFLEP